MQAMKAQETSESDVKAKTERNSLDIQAQIPERQKTQTRGEEQKKSLQHPLQTDSETGPQSFELLSLPDEQQETEEYMDTSEGPGSFVDITHKVVPGKR